MTDKLIEGLQKSLQKELDDFRICQKGKLPKCGLCNGIVIIHLVWRLSENYAF